VAQEALANVARHSRLVLSRGTGTPGDEIALIIEDDGAGFEMGHVEKGRLDSMRERLEATGGRLEISSQKGRGTRVMARMRRA
jgi:signal transduction histidine kinase